MTKYQRASLCMCIIFSVMSIRWQVVYESRGQTMVALAAFLTFIFAVIAGLAFVSPPEDNACPSSDVRPGVQNRGRTCIGVGEGGDKQ